MYISTMQLSNPETALVLKNLSRWVELYRMGMSCPEIAKKYGVHKSTVNRRLREQGIKIRSKSEVKKAYLNPMWRGNEVKYTALHRWVERRLPKPKACSTCSIRPALDLANIRNDKNSKTYTRDLNNWRWLCRKCHMLEDGRINNLYRGGAKSLQESCVICKRNVEGWGLCAKHYQQVKKHGVAYDY